MNIHSNLTRSDFFKKLGVAAAGTTLIPFIDRALKQLDRKYSDQYTLSPEITYLNHGSIGTIPRTIQKHHSDLLSLCETNPWLHMWGGEWDEPREIVREMAANYIGAKTTEIAITHNTTEVFNLLSLGLDLNRGDEVLFSNYNHSGASVAFQVQAPRLGYSVRQFQISLNDIESFTISDWVELHISNLSENTKLLVIPDVDNILGVKLPVRQIADAAKENGVRWVAVDAAQTVGMVPVDVKEMGIDLLATSAHKWIQAPKGVSFAYVSEAIQPYLSPVYVTWGQERWADSARKFEDYGTRNLAAVIALGEAISFQQDVSFRQKITHHNKLRDFAREAAEIHPDVRWRSPIRKELSSALYAIELKKRNAPEFNREMYQQHGIVVRPFGDKELNTLRISPNLMNTTDDLIKLFQLI